jgi:hypothetical protein
VTDVEIEDPGTTLVPDEEGWWKSAVMRRAYGWLVLLRRALVATVVERW